LYEGVGNKDNVHRYTFRQYLLMVVGLRGVQKGYEYSIATKLKDAGRFDDVEFHYTKEGRLRTRLLQAKHFIGLNRKITVEELLDKKGRFNLTKYFESYMQIRNSFSGELELLLCTNIGM